MPGLPDSGSFSSPVDAYTTSPLQQTCDPTVKPGTEAFATLILTSVGGQRGRIVEKCDPSVPVRSPRSEHKEGRAWDWMVSANVPQQKALAEHVLDWLLATDAKGNPHAMLRRAGLKYIIWNRNIWSVTSKAWEPYDGPSPHTDHVHFSFGWDGALGKTSLYTDSSAVSLPDHPQDIPVAKMAPGPARVVPFLAGLVIGVVALSAYDAIQRKRR